MPRFNALLAVIAGPLLGGCDRTPPVPITRIQAFRCSQHARLTCRDLPRGEAIHPDSLPPLDESFQLWVWHPGKARIVFRTSWSTPFIPGGSPAAKETQSEFPEASDSTMLSYSFAIATRTRYVVHVQATTPKGKVMSEDSVVWDYTGFPPPDTSSGAHHH